MITPAVYTNNCIYSAEMKSGSFQSFPSVKEGETPEVNVIHTGMGQNKPHQYRMINNSSDKMHFYAIFVLNG